MEKERKKKGNTNCFIFRNYPKQGKTNQDASPGGRYGGAFTYYHGNLFLYAGAGIYFYFI